MPDLASNYEAIVSGIATVLAAIFTGWFALRSSKKGQALSSETAQSAHILQAQEQIFKNFRRELARKEKEAERHTQEDRAKQEVINNLRAEITRMQGVINELRDRYERLAQDHQVALTLIKREIEEFSLDPEPDNNRKSS